MVAVNREETKQLSGIAMIKSRTEPFNQEFVKSY